MGAELTTDHGQIHCKTNPTERSRPAAHERLRLRPDQRGAGGPGRPPSTAARWTGSPRRSGSASMKIWGLDQPVLIRYGNWLREVAAGRLGYSYASGESVNAILAQRLPNTLVLFALSFFLAVVLALAPGAVGGDSPGVPPGPGDHRGQHRGQRGPQRPGGHRADLPILRPAGDFALVGDLLAVYRGGGGPAAPPGAAGDHHRPEPRGLLLPVHPGGDEGGAGQLLRHRGPGQPGLPGPVSTGGL